MTANSRVTANLTQVKYDAQLRRAVEGADIFSQFRGDVIGKNVLPGSIIAVSKQRGQTSKVMGLIKSLSGAGIAGRGALAGSEKKLEVVDFTAYGNEFKAGVNVDKFGIDAVANEPYGLLKLAVPLLGEFMEKFKGTHRREALCQRYSSNLTVEPSLSAGAVQHINSNFFVGGVAIASQPAYSDTLATYAAAINNAIPDTTAVAAANQMNLASIKKLSEWVVTQKRMKPYKDNKYIVTVPTRQKYNLMDETTGIGKLTIQTENKYNLMNWIGEWDNLIFVEDMRAPMLTATDGSSPTTLVWTYTTVNDSRPAPAKDGWDVSFVLGADAILELELEALHMEDDPTVEYGREKRTGCFANYGDQIIEYSDGTDVRINQGSAVAIFASAV